MNFTLREYAKKYNKNWTKIVGSFDTSILRRWRTWNIIFLLASVSIATTFIIDVVFSLNAVSGITSWHLLLASVFLSPYIEEVIFRGCLLGVLLYFLNRWGDGFRARHGEIPYYLLLAFAFMFQAWVFAIAHDRIFVLTVELLISGLCLGLAYWHFKKNLIPPMVLHSLINFLVFVIY